MKQVLLISILIFCSSISGKAQDTIVKVNGDVIVAKVIEISSLEVRYKKFTFLDGPTYVENKADINYIRYSGGLKEVFAPAKTEPKATETVKTNETAGEVDYYDPNGSKETRSGSNSGSSATAGSGSPKIQTWGMAYRYDGRTIKERQMQKILMETKDKQIIGLVQTAKDSQKMQYIGFGAFPLGIAAIYMLALSQSSSTYGNANSGQLAASGVLFVAAIACPITSGVFKHKRTLSNREAIERYNERY